MQLDRCPSGLELQCNLSSQICCTMSLPGFPTPDGGYSVCKLSSIAGSGPVKCGTTSVNLALSQVWSTKGITVRLVRPQYDADCLPCCEIEVEDQLLRPEGWVSPMLSNPHSNRHQTNVTDDYGLSFKNINGVPLFTCYRIETALITVADQPVTELVIPGHMS
jgi:hypothetical protein